jgi:hypothetical protein
MYVAVLPNAAKQEAGGSVGGVVSALHEALGRDGTFAVVAGGSFAGGSTVVDGGGAAADDAFDEHKADGVSAVLLDYVDRVGELQSGESSGGGGDGGGGGGGAGAAVLLGLGALGGGALLLSRRRRRKQEDAEFAEVKANARDDIVALGQDIRALDLDVEMPNADPGGKEAYARAVEAYEQADDAWDRARRPEDLEPVGAALEEGRWSMAVAKARLEGRPEPERRPPCFFDPRHGPSSREVEWCPPARPTPSVWSGARIPRRGRSWSAASACRTGTPDRCTRRSPGGSSAASAAVSSPG